MSVPIDNAVARTGLRRATQRFASLGRGIADPNVRIPDSEWTVGTCIVHVAAAIGDYADSVAGVRGLRSRDPQLGPTNAQIRAVNAQRMNEVADLRVDQLLRLIEETVERFITATAMRPVDEPYDWYGMQTSTLGAMTGVMLGEILLHGHDIARALRVPWPIDSAEATQALLGAMVLLPAYVDKERARGVKASYEIALRGGPRIGVRFDEGDAAVEYPPRPPFDCRLSADPVQMLLVAYGRRSPWGPALRGKIVARGRRPWLGPKFPKLILNP